MRAYSPGEGRSNSVRLPRLEDEELRFPSQKMCTALVALERVLTWVCPFLQERDLTLLATCAKATQPLLHRDRLWMTLLVRGV